MCAPTGLGFDTATLCRGAPQHLGNSDSLKWVQESRKGAKHSAEGEDGIQKRLTL